MVEAVEELLIPAEEVVAHHQVEVVEVLMLQHCLVLLPVLCWELLQLVQGLA